jgi:hypothetical protein
MKRSGCEEKINQSTVPMNDQKVIGLDLGASNIHGLIPSNRILDSFAAY